MTHPPQGSNPLDPLLHEAEAELATRLEEACAMHDVSNESTGELMRLEETLLDAARAAKQAVSVRRRHRTMRTARAGRGDAGAAAGGSDAETQIRRVAPSRLPTRDDEPDSVRDFVDEHRIEWRVWEVVPARREGSRTDPQLGVFQAGWLAFEAVDTGERRRLPNYPRDWNRLSNEALEALLARAEVGRSSRRPPPPPTDKRRDEPTH